MLLAMSTWSCEKYLDKVEASDLTEKDVFGTYLDFQAFADQMYNEVIAYLNHANNSSYNYGDHVIANASGMPTSYWDKGDYWKWYDNDTKTIFHEENGSGDNIHYEGIWDSSWRGIRAANVCLANFKYLEEATQEQRDLILGQAYFFRGFFHWEIIRAFGGMPYIDTLLQPADDMKFPRLSYQESTERIVEDLDRAINLLPGDWDLTVTGSEFEGANRGRATKGAALAVKCKALLFAASPLMNNESTGSGFVYDHDLLERSAEAAHQFFKLVGPIYTLEPFETYSNIFYTTDGTVPWRDEIIWQKTKRWRLWGYNGWKNQGIGRLHAGGRLGQVQNCEAPTHNIVEQFEMANGLPIDDPASGYDPADPWTGRDPRFDKVILTDGTRWVKAYPDTDERAYIQLYEGGGDQGIEGSLTGYLVKKYWPYGINNLDQDFGNYWHRCPILRVADVYLMYGEAVNEVYGPSATPNFNGETGISAADAINVVRTRAGMPDVHAKFTGDKDSFRERIRVERAVELCFESHRWHDIRRWHVAHLPEYKALYGNFFDKDHTKFNVRKIMDRVFDEKHYWLPLPKDQVLLYKEYYQNPGW